MPLKIIPTEQEKSAKRNPNHASESSSAAHDSIRYGHHSFCPLKEHPLQQRLQKWDETSYLAMQQLRRSVHGIHQPLQIDMEREITSHDFCPAALGGPSNMQRDILLGTDESISVEELYPMEYCTDLSLQDEIHQRHGL